MKLIIIYIPKTIRWHYNCDVTLLFFLSLFSRHHRNCFVALVENLKPKIQKKIIPNLWIVVRENALAIGGTVVPPSECHCKILYLLENQ